MSQVTAPASTWALTSAMPVSVSSRMVMPSCSSVGSSCALRCASWKAPPNEVKVIVSCAAAPGPKARDARAKSAVPPISLPRFIAVLPPCRGSGS